MQLSQTRNKSGFTLIEIIIVIVILGILAGVALPKLVENIDRGRAAEAFTFGSEVAKALDRCLSVETGGGRAAIANDLTNCNSASSLNISAPTTNFTWSFSNSANTLTMIALGNYSGAGSNDKITFTYDIGTGATTRTCDSSGKFAKLCK